MEASCPSIESLNRQTGSSDHKMRPVELSAHQQPQAPLPRERLSPSALHVECCTCKWRLLSALTGPSWTAQRMAGLDLEVVGHGQKKDENATDLSGRCRCFNLDRNL
jgi:hypothetical protein